jgi:CheY-like chemotaxis protein
MPPSAPRLPVLVVDDEPDVREALAMLLGLKGYEVHEADNGQAALDAMRLQKPAAVVLDLTMPVMDGWTLRKRMKDDPALAGVPIIVVSGVADVGPELVDCAVLKKPVESDRLLHALARCTTPGVTHA